MGMKRNSLNNTMKNLLVFRPTDWFLLIVCAGSFIITTVYIFSGNIEMFSSDGFAFNVLAHEQHLSRNIFPDGWNNSTQIQNFGITSIIWLLSFFMKNQVLMFQLSVFIWFLICIFSIIFLSCQIFSNKAFLLAIPFFSISYSWQYLSVTFGEGFYLVSALVSILIPVLVIETIDENFKLKYKNLFLFIFVYTFFGFYSITIVQQAGLPVLVGLTAFLVIKNYNKKITEFFKSNILGVLGTISLVVFGNMVLYLFVMKPRFLPSNYNDTLLVVCSIDNVLNNLIKFLQAIGVMLGFGFGENMLSLNGILMLIKTLFLILILFCFPICLIKKYKELNYKVQIWVLCGTVHIAEIFVILILGTTVDYFACARYLFTAFCLLALFSAYYLYEFFFSRAALSNLACFISVMYLMTYCGICEMPLIKSIMSSQEVLANKKSLTDFLLDNNLTFGYAGFWNANINTVLSDFKVRINPVESIGNNDALSATHWLSVDRYFEPSIHSGDTFFILDSIYDSYFYFSLAYKSFGMPLSVLNFSNYTIYIYDYNISENNFNNITANLNFDAKNLGICGEGYIDEYNNVHIKSSSFQYGPYCSLDAGTYSVNIKGENLDKIWFDATSEGGTNPFELEIILQNEKEISYIFSLDKRTDGIEFHNYNDSQEEVVIWLISVACVD